MECGEKACRKQPPRSPLSATFFTSISILAVSFISRIKRRLLVAGLAVAAKG
jgi:hypothetical protein